MIFFPPINGLHTTIHVYSDTHSNSLNIFNPISISYYTPKITMTSTMWEEVKEELILGDLS